MRTQVNTQTIETEKVGGMCATKNNSQIKQNSLSSHFVYYWSIQKDNIEVQVEFKAWKSEPESD